MYRGQWALTPEGTFREDPWFIVGGTEVLDSGFGKPPSEFVVRKLNDGVIAPGFVNAHTHLELSWLKGKLPAGKGIVQMANEIHRHRQDEQPEFSRKTAAKAIEHAYHRGTFFFNDISNDGEFSQFLKGANHFSGNRFFEILGFSPERAQQNIQKAKEVMAQDDRIFPTAHSVFGSSPEVMAFVREKSRLTSMSIHLLESPDESEFPFERGEIYAFLNEIGQYTRYKEIYQKNLLRYLLETEMLSFKKLFMVHLLHAKTREVDFLIENVSHSAWVLCHRSNAFLGYKRVNWDSLINSPLRLLIGTDSCATCDDVSVLDELLAISQTGKVPENVLLRAATWSAYEYLEVHPSRIPYFLFPGAGPSVESMARVERCYQLRG